MKKLLLFCILMAVSLMPRAFLIWAQDYYNDFSDGSFDKIRGEEQQEVLSGVKPPAFRFKNRMIELSLATSLNMSSDAFNAGNYFNDPIEMARTSSIFRENIIVNIDNFLGGFDAYQSVAIKPFSLNFNWKDRWGIGLDIAHVGATGHLSFSRNMFPQKETEKEKFGLSGAAFVDVGIPVFYNYNGYKIKLRPAAYIPLVYTMANNTYTYQKNSGKMHFEIDYDMRFYHPVDTVGMRDQDGDITEKMLGNLGNILEENIGYDFRLGVEYAVHDRLDVGVDIVNIPVPFATARLRHYAELKEAMFFDTQNISLADLIDGKGISLTQGPGGDYDYPELDDIRFEHGTDPEWKTIYRPFKTLFYFNYRFNGFERLSFIPLLGFSLNPVYPEVFSLEGGLSVRYDLANIFISVLGINYTDRVWKGSIDLALNLRAFELDAGVSLQSLELLSIYQGKGIGVNIGAKLGW